MTPIVGDVIQAVIEPMFGSLNVLLKHWFPDPAQAAQAEMELVKLKQAMAMEFLKSDTALALGQLEINKEEAKNTNWFVAGWRPAVGWICAGGVFYAYIGFPLLQWLAAYTDSAMVAPELVTGELLTLLMGMLGLGSLRTFEKYTEATNTHKMEMAKLEKQ
jgi:hypothetical protein